MVVRARNAVILALALVACAALASACGSTRLLHATSTRSETVTVSGAGPSGQASAGRSAGASLTGGIPLLATKNTTRIDGSDPVSDAAEVALAVFPSVAPGTHPHAVALAPTASWQEAIAASVLMAPPIRAPLLLSGSTALPAVTHSALSQLAPTGSGPAGGAQLIRVGAVPAAPAGLHAAAINGANAFTVAAGIDRFVSAVTGRPSRDVVIASSDSPAYAMPAAGWAAESGDPILYVTPNGIPVATRQALLSHGRPNIYVLGPPSVIPNAVVAGLRRYGPVKRVGATDPGANSVAFAVYRDPACPYGQPCAHIPGSFGWAIRSPGHGYVLLNASRPLDAAASAPLSSSGSYGPQLILDGPSTLPRAVLNFFLDYATPGYTQEGPTAAVYNHGWMIGGPQVISVGVQAEVDTLLEAVPQTNR
jgi:hypothetical protein